MNRLFITKITLKTNKINENSDNFRQKKKSIPAKQKQKLVRWKCVSDWLIGICIYKQKRYALVLSDVSVCLIANANANTKTIVAVLCVCVLKRLLRMY